MHSEIGAMAMKHHLPTSLPTRLFLHICTEKEQLVALLVRRSWHQALRFKVLAEQPITAGFQLVNLGNSDNGADVCPNRNPASTYRGWLHFQRVRWHAGTIRDICMQRKVAGGGVR